MTPQKPQEPTILESSETESFTSDKMNSSSNNSIGDDLSLDDLFNNLKQEIKPTNNILIDEESDYKKIEKSIAKLPKINSNLEQSLEIKSNKNKTSIRIHDPVTVVSKKENEKETTDGRWFHMKQPELTAEIKRDLSIIQQRNALDPKRHYKKEKWQIPKYFQMGTIIEGNTEFYSSRLNRKQRGKNLITEILNDNQSTKYFKRKYSEIQITKTSGKKAHYKSIQKARRKF